MKRIGTFLQFIPHSNFKFVVHLFTKRQYFLKTTFVILEMPTRYFPTPGQIFQFQNRPHNIWSNDSDLLAVIEAPHKLAKSTAGLVLAALLNHGPHTTGPGNARALRNEEVWFLIALVWWWYRSHIHIHASTWPHGRQPCQRGRKSKLLRNSASSSRPRRGDPEPVKTFRKRTSKCSLTLPPYLEPVGKER